MINSLAVRNGLIFSILRLYLEVDSELEELRKSHRREEDGKGRENDFD